MATNTACTSEPSAYDLTEWDGNAESLPAHIRALGPIPPAWKNVRYSEDPESALYLLGVDEKGRSQYVYSPEHVRAAAESKFARVEAYLDHISNIRSYINALAHEDTKDCLMLIFETGLRPGSDRETFADKSARGATTLLGENVVPRNRSLFLEFVGKDGVFQSHELLRKQLRENVAMRADRAGKDGRLYNTSSTALRKALEPLGLHPKDLRTLLACRTAKKLLDDMEPVQSATAFVKARNTVADAVSSLLGNTRTIALGSYIDPELFANWSPTGYRAWQDRQEKQAAKRTKKHAAAFATSTVQNLAGRANASLADHIAQPSHMTAAEESAYDARHGYADAED